MSAGIRSPAGGGSAIISVDGTDALTVTPTDLSVAGVPVVESGSNADGTWVKFLDGTMVCHQTINCGSRISFGAGTYANPYRSTAVTWTYPQTFIAAPTIQLTQEVNHGTAHVRASTVGLQSRTATSCLNIQIVAVTDNAQVLDVFAHCVAVGRWKA